MLHELSPYLLSFSVVTGLFLLFEALAWLHLELFQPESAPAHDHLAIDYSERSLAEVRSVSAPVHATRR